MGWFAVYFKILNKDTYILYAGIVGGLASVVGLLSFTRPAITKTDLQEIEMESLLSVAKTSEELNNLEKERAKTEEELGDLAVQKKEMELLVKKASLALFLKEQHSYIENKIVDELKRNESLSINLEKINDVSEKLSALNEEIDSDPNVSQLREVIRTASKRQPTLDDVINDMPHFSKFVFLFTRELSRSITNIVSAIK